MNIKTLQPHIPIAEQNVTKVDGAKNQVKSESSSKDRDAQGRQEGQSESQQGPMSDEEFAEALETLKELPGFKSHALRVEIKKQGEHRVLYLRDAEGKVFKRLLVADLWGLLKDKMRKVGQLLDKSV